jgi:hypothetical protein
LSSTENFVTQWKSACTCTVGSAPNSGQDQVCSPPLAVAPATVKSQVSGENGGTRP